MMPDETLVTKVLDGDSKALDELLERYYPKILKYCLWHLSSKEEAEDATQEVMIKMVRHEFKRQERNVTARHEAFC